MSKPLDHFHYGKEGLSADGVSLAEIADSTGTPVYIYSAKGFLEPLRRLRTGLKGLDHLICFAVKSNSNIALLRMLAEEGAGTDIVSGGELFRAEAAGVKGERIVFSGVGKTPGEIASALQYDGGKGIFSFNVESVPELEMINAVALEFGFQARIALRFNPDVDAKTHPYISTGLKRNKFGLNRSEILSVVEEIAKSPDLYGGILLRGLAIHIGSQVLALTPLADAFARLRALIDDVERRLPGSLEFADLGGGIGIAYQKEKTPAIERYCALIQRHFTRTKLKILIEPGRILSGNSGVLLTEVLYRKTRGAKDFLIVDAAMNDLARPSLYGSHHEIVPADRPAARTPLKKTDIVGPVCESSDCFGEGRKLPANVKQGDLLAILSAGAYGFTMSSNYNSRPRPPEVLVRDGSFEVIRERESYEDLIRGEAGSKQPIAASPER